MFQKQAIKPGKWKKQSLGHWPKIIFEKDMWSKRNLKPIKDTKIISLLINKGQHHITTTLQVSKWK